MKGMKEYREYIMDILGGYILRTQVIHSNHVTSLLLIYKLYLGLSP